MNSTYAIATPSPTVHSGFAQALLRIRYMLAWLTVRPRRWFFWQCIAKGSFGTQWLPRRREQWDDYDPTHDRKRTEWEMIEWPNLHWVIAYHTVFAFFKWLHWDGWRLLCRWGPRSRETFPWYARLVRKIGQTTAGAAISGGECYHCASDEGDPMDLCDDETGTTFIFQASGTSQTMDGTDHWFRGTTICPKCGYRQEYSSSSL